MATHSSILAWRIPWQDEPGELQSMALQRVRNDLASDNSAAAECKPKQVEISVSLTDISQASAKVTCIQEVLNICQNDMFLLGALSSLFLPHFSSKRINLKRKLVAKQTKRKSKVRKLFPISITEGKKSQLGQSESEVVILAQI